MADKSMSDSDVGRTTKGRGFKENTHQEMEERYTGKGSSFEDDAMDDKQSTGPLKSVEGWIIVVSGVHEEASEDELMDKFSEFGEVKNIQMPLDRRTGFVKGYALLAYEKREAAEAAIKGMNDAEFMDKSLSVDWAFFSKTNRNKK